MGHPAPVRFEPGLYAAAAQDLLRAARATPPQVRTLLLIGHNPGLEDLVLTLAGDGVDDTLERLRVKFPTSAIAVLTWYGRDWAALAPGAALLTSLTVPRGAKR